MQTIGCIVVCALWWCASSSGQKKARTQGRPRCQRRRLEWKRSGSTCNANIDDLKTRKVVLSIRACLRQHSKVNMQCGACVNVREGRSCAMFRTLRNITCRSTAAAVNSLGENPADGYRCRQHQHCACRRDIVHQAAPARRLINHQRTSSACVYDYTVLSGRR